VTIICCSQDKLIRESFLQRSPGAPPFGVKQPDQDVKKHDLVHAFSPFVILQTA